MNADRAGAWGVELALRWLARGLSGALFLFWGAFFVAHLGWFADPARLPPAWVCLTVGLHFLMLLGFLVGWKWELPGALLVLAAAWPFFWVAAGPNFLLFAAVSSLPAVLWLACGLMTTRATRAA